MVGVVVVTVSVVTVVVVMVVLLCSDPDMPATAGEGEWPGMIGALLIMSGTSEITVSSLCILFCLR